MSATAQPKLRSCVARAFLTGGLGLAAMGLGVGTANAGPTPTVTCPGQAYQGQQVTVTAANFPNPDPADPNTKFIVEVSIGWRDESSPFNRIGNGPIEFTWPASSLGAQTLFAFEYNVNGPTISATCSIQVVPSPPGPPAGGQGGGPVQQTCEPTSPGCLPLQHGHIIGVKPPGT